MVSMAARVNPGGKKTPGKGLLVRVGGGWGSAEDTPSRAVSAPTGGSVLRSQLLLAPGRLSGPAVPELKCLGLCESARDRVTTAGGAAAAVRSSTHASRRWIRRGLSAPHPTPNPSVH